MIEPADDLGIESELLVRFSLWPVVRAKLAGRHRVFFYDPYGRDHGLLFVFFFWVLGRGAAEAWVDRIARLTTLPLRAVVHGRRVKGYHRLHHRCSIDIGIWLDEIRRQPGFDGRLPFRAEHLSPDERMSLLLKSQSVRAAHLLVAIRVVKRLTDNPVRVRIDSRSWPQPILRRIAEAESIEWIPDRANPMLDVAALMAAAVTAIVPFVAAIARRPVTPRPAKVATDIDDPRCLMRRPGDANFLVGDEIAADDFVFYTDRTLDAPTGDSRIVDVRTLPATTSDLRLLLDGIGMIITGGLHAGMPLRTLLDQLAWWKKYVYLGLLFRSHPPRVHVYLNYKNGSTGWKLDSSIVTAVCRRHGVHSLTYQTRMWFGSFFEYFWDCYDTWAVWGPWWRDQYRARTFVTRIEAMGSPYLDEYPKASRPLPDEQDGPSTKSVLIIPTDINADEAQCWTLEYVVLFLRTCLAPIVHLNERAGRMLFRVAIKPKHLGHIPLLSGQPELATLFNSPHASVEFLRLERHETVQAIRDADIVIAVMNTTPGADAMLLGRPTVYFDDMWWGDGYASHFPAIVRTEAEVEAFVSGRHTTSATFLDQLDPFRDGHARRRIAHMVSSIAADTSVHDRLECAV